jgi:hypothetical protein
MTWNRNVSGICLLVGVGLLLAASRADTSIADPQTVIGHQGLPVSENSMPIAGSAVASSKLGLGTLQRACPCLSTICTYPYGEDFEAGMGLWQNVEGDDFDWDRYQGSTPTDNTGPEADHTLGTEEGYYLYTEASGDNYPYKTAIIDGPCFDLSTLSSPELSFWYHMAGDSMGSLNLEVSGNGCNSWDIVFERNGHQGYDWLLAVVDLSGYAGQTIVVRFRGVTGDGYESDMAIDDIYAGEAVVYQGGCCNLDTGECLGLMTEAECQALGHVTWYRISDCSEDNFCPQPPPANDLCENAIEILSGPFTAQNVNYRWARPDLDVGCNDEACTESGYGVWYKYTATEYCGARITAAPTEGGWSLFIAAFTGTGCGDLSEIACSSGYGAEATFDMTAGTTYWILIGSFWCGDQPSVSIDITFTCSLGACCLGETCALETVSTCAALSGIYLGDGTVCTPDICHYGACCTSNGCELLTSADCSAAGGDFKGNGTLCGLETCPPVNESCPAAIPITDGTPAVVASTSLASWEDDAEASCQEWSDRDVWYVYIATCTGSVAVDTEGSELWDTILSVWDECGGTEIACDDESGTDSLSYLTFDAIAGETYYIRLASFFGVGGEFHINISCTQASQGTCCTGGACSIDYRLTCEAAGGMYGGDGTVCAGSDCNSNGIEDICDILSGVALDCNANGVPDECDIAGGTSHDFDGNGVPDECDPDCNGNGIVDGCDLTCEGGCASVPGCGMSADCQNDAIPDDCQLIIKDCSGVRYDSGTADFVNGLRPDGGWAYYGVADDFVLTQAAEGTCLRFDMYDFVGSGNLNTVRVRIYDNPSGLMNLGSFWSAIPLFDQTYSVGAGTLTISDTGQDLYYYDLLRFVGTGPAYSLAAGSYAVHLTFPDTWDAGFWATSGTDGSDCAVIWGEWQDSPADACSGGDNLTRLSFALLGDRSNDLNQNGVPDECDLCGGDFASSANPPYGTPDGRVNEADYWYIHDGLGYCRDHAAYWEHMLADMDGDGCISLVDYQSWVTCYRMYTGKAFVAPKVRPAPPPKPLSSKRTDSSAGSVDASVHQPPVGDVKR